MAKSKAIVISISFILMVVLMILLLYIVLTMFFIHKDAPQMSADELKTFLYENEETFQFAAKIMIENPSIIEITENHAFSGTREDWYFYKTNNGLLISTKEELHKDVLTMIENSSINNLFVDNGINKISLDYGGIYFIEGTELGRASGIYYSFKGEEPSQYVIETYKIKDKWYYLESS